jgi:CBS domain containing-hemolysin-like protein
MYASIVVLLSSTFALMESAIVFTDDIKLQYLLRKTSTSDKKKEMIAQVINQKDKYMSSLAIIGTTINITSSSFLSVLASKTLSGNGFMIYMGCLIYFMLVFQKILPKIIAIKHYEAVIIKSIYFVRFIKLITTPFLIFTLMWVKLVKGDKKRKMSLSELKSVINYFSQNGIVDKEEEKMMDNILSIKNKKVEDILNLRNEDLITLDFNRKIKKYRQLIIETKAKIYLVKDNEKIIGIAFYRDLANKILEDEERKSKVSECVKSAITVNSSDDLLHVILDFHNDKDRYAIVKNDENEVIGILTAKQVYTYALH